MGGGGGSGGGGGGGGGWLIFLESSHLSASTSNGKFWKYKNLDSS